MKKISFLVFAFSFVIAVFSVVEKAQNFGWLPEEWSRWITLISTTLSAISLCITLWIIYQQILQKISEEYGKILNTISSIKGVLPNGKETDVVRRLLEMQLGEEIASRILPPDASFPVSLVPGGDVALIMNQSDYSKVLIGLLTTVEKEKPTTQIYWTTFVPFESLNKNLSGYTPEQWSSRLGGVADFTPEKNINFFNYVHQWASIGDNGKQIIILDRTAPRNKETHLMHPLNYQKYANGGKFNLDLIKYLCVRYGVRGEGEFLRYKENDFLESKLKEEVKKSDETNSNVKWISLAKAIEIVKGIQIRYRQGIYNIDFVYFNKPGNDFVLVRVDADNGFVLNDGGIVGVTFVVFTFHSLKIYFKLFDKMFEEAKQTFEELNGTSL